MFRVKSKDDLEKMGFEKDEMTGDYKISKVVNDTNKLLFRVYRGSDYIRHAKTGYIIEDQMKLIYDWTQNDLIYWEEE